LLFTIKGVLYYKIHFLIHIQKNTAKHSLRFRPTPNLIRKYILDIFMMFIKNKS
jgi:hypothetical protein